MHRNTMRSHNTVKHMHITPVDKQQSHVMLFRMLVSVVLCVVRAC
jgi:hypothetical protein